MTDRPNVDGGQDSDRSAFVASCTYEPGDNESMSEAIVRAVAALTDSSPLELDPLYDVIDPEHLDGFFEDASKTTRPSQSFTLLFNGCEVEATPDRISVRNIDGDAPD